MRRLLTLLVVLSAALFSSSARAVLLPYYDLTSVALDSEQIVFAKRTSPPETALSADARFRVTRVFQGSLQVGDELDLDLGGYRLDDPWVGSVGRDPRDLDAQMAFFLTRNRRDGEGTARPWQVGLSGLCVGFEGKVQRFVTSAPKPQGGALTMTRDEEVKEGISWDELAVTIELAIARGSALRSAQNIVDDKSRKDAFLALLEPVGGPPPVLPGQPFVPHRGMLSDLVTTAILQRLHRDRDLEGLLEAFTRSPYGADGALYDLDEGDTALFATAALDPKRPLAQRIAATWLLGKPFAKLTATTKGELLALLKDPIAELRVAGAVLLERDEPSHAEARSPLSAAWVRETDPSAIHAFAVIARDLDLTLPPRADKPFPIVHALNHDRVVHFGYVGAPGTQPLLDEARAVATDARGASFESDRRNGCWSSSNGLGGCSFGFKPELAPGRYRVVVQILFDGEPPRELELAPLEVAAREPPKSAPTPLPCAGAPLPNDGWSWTKGALLMAATFIGFGAGHRLGRARTRSALKTL